MSELQYDVAIIGGGPAGLQAALILARTRRKVIVFDSPEPPRNAASHGVHNLMGLDDMKPAEIRAQAWAQIEKYQSATWQTEQISDIQPHDDHHFTVIGDAGTRVTAKHVILAHGYRDLYPDVPGFMACWGHTIIPCPYCDGYENRDRVWGLVASSQMALEHMPHLYHNWTQHAKLIVTAKVQLDDAQRAQLQALDIPFYEGDIVEVHHTDGEVSAVTLSSGERVAVQTLWWREGETHHTLTDRVIDTFSLTRDDNGLITVDANHQSSHNGLWVVGDLRGWAGAVGAMYQASLAAYAITRQP